MEEKRYKKRKEKALSERNVEHFAVACNYLGDYYNQQGRYREAVEEYKEEAEAYRKISKPLDEARAHRMAGEMLMLLCEFEVAKKHISAYLDISKQLQNSVEKQRAYTTIGRMHLLHGQSIIESNQNQAVEQFKLAEKNFLKSLLLVKEISGKISKLEQLDMQARCYLNIGIVKEHMEEFEESIVYIEKALKICQTHDLFELMHLCYVSMSLLYHCKKRDSTLALRYCNLALDVAKRLPNKVKKICETLITKSEIILREGDFASAKQILTKAYKKNTPDDNDRSAIEKSLRIVVKICKLLDELILTSLEDMTKLKSIYEKLGDGCCHLQLYTKAIEFYKKMLECAEKNGETGKELIPIYVSLYQTYKDNKDYDKALEYLWREFDLNKDEPDEAFTTLCSITDVCELQSKPFWTIHDILMKAKDQVERAHNSKDRLERIFYARLRKLQQKHNMNVLAAELEEEIKSRGIDINSLDDDSDTESEAVQGENNVPIFGSDVCLESLTDSDTSDLDETEKPRPQRTTRGTRSLTIKRNNKGETQLHQACIAGNIELVRRLLDQGHTVNVRDHAGWLPLHEACNHGFRDIVELLLDKGAMNAINDKGGTSCDGITPLYDACSNGFLDVVELLLERGADVTLKTDFGETCLNALDLWRRKATVSEDEQIQYELIRSNILKRLARVGICSEDKNSTPLTNSQTMPSDSDSEKFSDNEPDNSDVMSALKENSWINTQKSTTIDSKPLSAGKDYKIVMEQMRHPKRLSLSNDTQSNSSLSVKQKRSALLGPDEVDVDSWLIDEMKQEKKKRRCNSITRTGDLGNQSTSSGFERATSFNCGNYRNDPFADDHETLEYRVNAFDRLQNPKGDVSAKHIRRSSDTNKNVLSLPDMDRKNKKIKYQTSLLAKGFSRLRSESPKLVDTATCKTSQETEPDSTTNALNIPECSQVKHSPEKQQTIAQTFSFKIKVEDELLLIPIDRKRLNEANIRWLAEEAARRYYNIVGQKPVLRLKTSDGFAYEENDPLSVATEGNMLLGVVLEWRVLPLPQRYEEVCHQLKREMNTEILSALEKAELTNIIQLDGEWLTTAFVEPIFRSIFHHNSLRAIDLSNNFIQNDGCRQLSKCLVTLKQLNSLKLRGNLITEIGLSALCLSSGFDKFENFEELDLSQNPLGNSSLRFLEKLCKATDKTLRKLYLSNCSLSNLYDYDLNFFQLTHFDISYNHLIDASHKAMLDKLNTCRLQYINLNFASTSITDSRIQVEAANNIAQFFESGTCEKFKRIELNGCYLSDSTLFRITQCLSKSIDLDVMDISENDKLSVIAFKYIVQHLPQLKRLLAVNCPRFVAAKEFDFIRTKGMLRFIAVTLSEDEISSNDILCNLRNFWLSIWSSQGRIKVCDRYIELYTNNDIEI